MFKSPVTWIILAALLALNMLIAFLGSWITAGSVDTWYQTINRPSFTPPDRVFGPVWTTLYLLMGLSAWWTWLRGRTRGVPVNRALSLYFIQLALNLLWSFLFFGLMNPFLALLEIILLWVAILLTMVGFFRISRVAGMLLIPYLLWAGFAAVLNFEIVRLN